MSTDFKGYLLEEFLEDYQQGVLSRRQAIKLIAGVVGSVAVADTLLAACAPAPALVTATTWPGATSTVTIATSASQAADGSTVAAPAAEGEIEADWVTLSAADAELSAYLARPVGDGPYQAILVCHENRGLTEHIQDVARRLAAAGYVGLAVDLLTREGGSAALDPADVPGILANSPSEQFVQDFIDGWIWLRSQPFVKPEAAGMVGFCFGGGVTWRVAIGLPDVRAAVPFYGPHPAPADLATIEAAVLAIYAESDQRINQTIPQIEAAMQDYGKVYEYIVYPGTDHAFHNDTGSRYVPQAAQDAWARTLAWFATHLA